MPNDMIVFVLSDDEKAAAREHFGRLQLDPPLRQTEGSAGYDLPSAIDITIRPGDQVLVPTGWRAALPRGTSGEIETRSGWAMKHRISHRAGLIDCDYRGEIKVLLVNEGLEPFSVKRGDRIAQMVIRPYETPDVVVQTEFNDTTDRGSGGFGSTGGRG